MIYLSIGFITIILVLLYFPVRYIYEKSLQSHLTTQEISPGVFAIDSGGSNFYLVKCHNKFIAFDAGANRKIIVKELKDLGINTNDIAAVFLTHTDHDHIGGLELFQNAQVFISEQERQMIEGNVVRKLFVKNSMNTPYQVLNNNQKVSICGITVEVILTPGHTLGSVCFLVDKTQLFVGDAISLKDGRAGIFNNFFNMDSIKAKNSMAYLTSLQNIKHIYTAHYGFTEDFNKAFSRPLE